MAMSESLRRLLPHGPSEGDSRSLGGVTQQGTPGEMVQKHKSPPSKARCPPVIPHIIQSRKATGSWLFLGRTSRLGSAPQS